MATIKSSEIKAEAKKTINVIFGGLIISDDKEKWKAALAEIDKIVLKHENGDRGAAMFMWREVKKIMNTKFGKKFILKK